MRGMEEAAIFMGAGIAKLNAMMPHGDYRKGIGKKLRKAKKAKRRQQKQSKKWSRR